MKPIDRSARTARGRGPVARTLGLAAFLLYAVMATVANASQVLVASTTLVSGSESAVYSFNAPGPGTVSVQLTNLDWPQALSSLSFMATTSSQVLSPWSDATSGAQPLSFLVSGAGTYYADITAVAGGPLDLGVYSFSIDFTPAASPVPLPSSGALLLFAVAGIFGLISWRRGTLTRSACAAAALPAR